MDARLEQIYSLELDLKEVRTINDAIVLVKNRKDCKGFLELYPDLLDFHAEEGFTEVTKREAKFLLGVVSGHHSGDYTIIMGLMMKLGMIVTDGEER